MSKPIVETPDVLVLGGGGVLGEAWMSAVLAGLDEAEGFDARLLRSVYPDLPFLSELEDQLQGLREDRRSQRPPHGA